jgi:isopentenyl-diphosphate Delta-isomerase
MEERLILINLNNEIVGSETKMRVHQQGLLHRAFSVFIFNVDGCLLLQKRAHHKYHSQDLWTNSCCGHPRVGESTNRAVHRRLQEEMGFDCPMKQVENFLYRAEVSNGLIEHEYDQIYIGRFDGTPVPSPDEVEDWTWTSIPALLKFMTEQPEEWTIWFRRIVENYGNSRLEDWAKQAVTLVSELA